MSPIVHPPKWLRPRAIRAAVAAGVAVACAAGTAVAVAAAPGSTAAATAPAVTAHAGSPAGKPPPINHQLCYAAKGQYKIPPKIELADQFSPRGFVPKLGAVASHCNPVEKILPTARFPVTNPAAHLLCLTITAAKQPRIRSSSLTSSA